MPVTQTILSKRVGLPLCFLGDLTSTPPGVGITSYRVINNAFGQNRIYGDDYPSTMPDEIMRKVRAYNGVSYCPGPAPRVYGVLIGGIMNNTVTTGFPPSPIPGSPFYSDDRGGGTGVIYPRWTGETAYNWDTTGAGYFFTPADWPDTSSTFDFSNGLTGPGGKSIAMSYNTGPQPNDPMFGGDSNYTYQSFVRVFVDAPEPGCWNDGAQLEINLDIWKVDQTLTYLTGTYGAHSFIYGTPAFDQTVTHTITLDSTSCIGSPYHVVDLLIPDSLGYLTYLDDFYITSVTAP